MTTGFTSLKDIARSVTGAKEDAVTKHRHGGWHKPQPAWARRSQATAPTSHVPATLGDYKPTIIPAKPKAPADSWWTKTRSREEFDRRAAERGREAGWVGCGVGDLR